MKLDNKTVQCLRHQECLYSFRGDVLCMMCKDYEICRRNRRFNGREQKLKHCLTQLNKHHKRAYFTGKGLNDEKIFEASFMEAYGITTPFTVLEYKLIDMVNRAFDGKLREAKLTKLRSNRRAITFRIYGYKSHFWIRGTNDGLALTYRMPTPKKNRIFYKHITGIHPLKLEEVLRKAISENFFLKKEV